MNLKLGKTTHLVGSEGTSADDSLARPVAPGGAGESSVAAKSAGVAAGHQIIGREVEVHLALGMDAHLHIAKSARNKEIIL